MRKLQLCVDDWATGLDTGAVYGNNLTDIITETAQPYFGTVEKEILVTQIKNQREKLYIMCTGNGNTTHKTNFANTDNNEDDLIKCFEFIPAIT